MNSLEVSLKISGFRQRSVWQGSFPFIMNIRQRVFFFMAGCLVAITAIGGFSYSYLSEMENIHKTSEITDDISNNILEIRRSENFFSTALRTIWLRITGIRLKPLKPSEQSCLN